MTILVTGAGGQLGSALERLCTEEGRAVRAPGHRELDITDESHVARALEETSLLVNAAAYTGVDDAEAHPARAHAVNAEAAGLLARECAKRDIAIIHLSTDYVFDGSGAPYREDDPTSPLNVYGESKQAGEAMVRQSNPRHIILRTSWVFGLQGANFVKTVCRLARERDELTIVDDQCAAPTFADDLARAILTVADAPLDEGLWGTYHYTGAPSLSWFAFAREILAELGSTVPLRAISTEEFNAAAARPLDSRLDCAKFEGTFSLAPAPWRPGVQAVVAQERGR